MKDHTGKNGRGSVFARILKFYGHIMSHPSTGPELMKAMELYDSSQVTRYLMPLRIAGLVYVLEWKLITAASNQRRYIARWAAQPQPFALKNAPKPDYEPRVRVRKTT